MEGLSLSYSGIASASYGLTFGTDINSASLSIVPPPVENPPVEGGYSPSSSGWGFESAAE